MEKNLIDKRLTSEAIQDVSHSSKDNLGSQRKIIHIIKEKCNSNSGKKICNKDEF